VTRRPLTFSQGTSDLGKILNYLPGRTLMKRLFTERQGELKPRVGEALDGVTAAGLMGLISARIEEQWFGLIFPFA
jgi:hypothetical protein